MAQYICPWRDEAKKKKKKQRLHFKPVCREVPSRAEDTFNKQTIKWWGNVSAFVLPADCWFQFPAGFTCQLIPSGLYRECWKKGFNYSLVMLEGVRSNVCAPFCVCAATSPHRSHLQLQCWAQHCCSYWAGKFLEQQQTVTIGIA